jgi:hypothetical protein
MFLNAMRCGALIVKSTILVQYLEIADFYLALKSTILVQYLEIADFYFGL